MNYYSIKSIPSSIFSFLESLLAPCFLLPILLLFCFLPMSIPVHASAVHASSAKLSLLILSDTQKTMEIGEESSFTAVTSEFKQPTFKSSSNIVSITFDQRSAFRYRFLITAKKAGTATITIRCGSARATCKITVKKTVLKLNKKSISLQRNSSFQLSASASNHSFLQFKSSKSSVASVDSTGLITAKKAGETTITVTANGGSAVCRVTVVRPTIKLSSSSLSLYKNQTHVLTASVSSKETPKWSSSKKSVAIISPDGTITALKHGTTVITARLDGTERTCIVTVKPPTIVLNKTDILLYVGQSTTLCAVVSSHCQPKFKSSRSSIVSVDSSGHLFAQKVGEAMIYVSEDGTKVGCRVHVLSKH